jgi:hypothetical protein
MQAFAPGSFIYGDRIVIMAIGTAIFLLGTACHDTEIKRPIVEHKE